jgi:hypothetical protein
LPLASLDTSVHSRPFAYLGFLLVLASQGALVVLGDAAAVSASLAIQLFGLGTAGVCLVVGGLVQETELGPLTVRWFQWIGLGLLLVGAAVFLGVGIDYWVGRASFPELLIGSVIGGALALAGRDVLSEGGALDLERFVEAE